MLTKEPAEHVLQAAAFGAPAYEPGLHGSGLVAPVAHAAPMGHAVQSCGASLSVALEKLPSSHGSAAPAPTGQKDPAKHTTHAVLDPRTWNVPAAQYLQALQPVSDAYEPGLQAVAFVAPDGQALPAGQVAQSDCAVAPVELRKLPAAHAVGAVAPRSQYEPAGHAMHRVALLKD